MECEMVAQGFERGSCLTKTHEGFGRACKVTLKYEGGRWYRLIRSAILSRPEDYYSIYQSGCNHSCLKCHSWYFTQIANGYWVSTDQIAQMVSDYELSVTVREPRKRATIIKGMKIIIRDLPFLGGFDLAFCFFGIFPPTYG